MKTLYLPEGPVYFDSEDAEVLSGWDWYVIKHPRYRSPIVQARRRRFRVMMHRIITGAGPDEEVRHINGNGLDNRKNNLIRGHERVKGYSGASRYRGVAWDAETKKWRVTLGIVNGRTLNLGRYVDEIEAAKAYDEAAFKQWGEFARLNFEGSDAL